MIFFEIFLKILIVLIPCAFMYIGYMIFRYNMNKERNHFFNYVGLFLAGAILFSAGKMLYGAILFAMGKYS